MCSIISYCMLYYVILVTCFSIIPERKIKKKRYKFKKNREKEITKYFEWVFLELQSCLCFCPIT